MFMLSIYNRKCCVFHTTTTLIDIRPNAISASLFCFLDVSCVYSGPEGIL